MELKLNIEKKHVYLLGFLIILIGGVLFVQGQGVNNFGHGANDLYVDIGGSEKTLQAAVNDGDFGETLVTVNGVEKTLQIALDDGDIVTSDDLESSGSVGVDQTWTNVKSSRQTRVTYTNNEDRPIMVIIAGYEGYNSMDGCELKFKIDQKYVYDWSAHAGCAIFAIIPVGSTYEAQFLEGSILSWYELR